MKYNYLLTCLEMGLASVCVGGYDEEALCDLLDIPEDIYPMCILEIGYPAYKREPLSWYSEDAVYYNRFDQDRERKFRTLQDLQDDIEKGIM